MEVGGVLFFAAFLRPLHDWLATEKNCSCNDGGGKLFYGIKQLKAAYSVTMNIFRKFLFSF